MSWIIALIVIFSLVDRLKVFNNPSEDNAEKKKKSLEREKRRLQQQEKKVKKEKSWIEQLYDITLEDEADERLKKAYEKARKNHEKLIAEYSKKDLEKEIQPQEKRIRRFSELFPDSNYSLEDIHRLEKDLTEEEFLYYREDIYRLEEEILEKERRKRRDEMRWGEGEEISTPLNAHLPDLQKMVVLKEILDPPVSRKS